MSKILDALEEVSIAAKEYQRGRQEGYRAGIEAAAAVADEERISMQLAGERAYVAKRYNIADHRYSDSDTAKRISERIRALLEKQP